MPDYVPITMDFYVHQGDTFSSGIKQYLRDGVPIDLTGAAGLCQVRTDPASGVVSTLPVTIVDAVNCRYRIDGTAAVMASIPAPDNPTAYYQDVQFLFASGYTQTFSKGTLYLTPEVSR
ncbi:MAG: hypothetical protein AB9917_02235 [Negativicutes bacterium]